MIEHIMLTIDNTAYAQPAAEFVAELAKKYQSKVTIVYTYKPAPTNSFSTYFLGFGADKASLRAQSLVKQFVEQIKRMGVARVKGELFDGAPSEALQKAAGSLKPDLIVIGSRRNSFSQSPNEGRAEAITTQPIPAPVLIV
jgi:nucleotide-binding universal stress UspA family protein